MATPVLKFCKMFYTGAVMEGIKRGSVVLTQTFWPVQLKWHRKENIDVNRTTDNRGIHLTMESRMLLSITKALTEGGSLTSSSLFELFESLSGAKISPLHVPFNMCTVHAIRHFISNIYINSAQKSRRK